MLRYIKRAMLVVAGLLPVFALADISIQITDSQGKPLSNAVVFLKSPNLLASAKPLKKAEIAQVNRTFTPDVQVVTLGTAVDFPNRDDVRHHVYSFSPAKTFELKLYTGKPEAPIVFDEIGIIELGCNIHDSMLGWVLVNNTPLFSTTDASGYVHFDVAPSEEYSVDVWHRNFPYGAPFEAFKLMSSDSAFEYTLALQTPGVSF